MERVKRRPKQKNEPTLIASSLKGGACGLALTLMLALIMPFAALSGSDPAALIIPLAGVCVLLGSFSGAFIAAKMFRESALASGMLSQTVILIPMLSASLIVSNDEKSVLSILVPLLSLPIGAIAGTLAASRSGNSSRKRMKKLMRQQTR